MLKEIAITDTSAKDSFLLQDSSEDEESIGKFKVHLYLTEEHLAETFAQVFGDLYFPFTNVLLDGISALPTGIAPVQIIPQMQKNLKKAYIIISVIIGPSSKSFKVGFDTLQFEDNAFNTALVSPNLGALDRTLFELRKPWMQAFFVIGTQAHLSDDHFMRQAEAEGLKSTRLGILRANAGIVEPEIRSADLFGVSLNAIKHGDAPIQKTITSTGLSSEEACQYAYYAGRSEKNKICCLFDFSSDAPDNPHGVNLLATLTW